MSNSKERIKKLIKSSEKALLELDKLINQTIDLSELDPERAKQAAQGKIEAIQGSFDIINKIDELNAILEDSSNINAKKESIFSGVENRI